MGRPVTRAGYRLKQIPISPEMDYAVGRYRHKTEAKSEVEAYLKLITAGLDAYDKEWPRWRRKKENADS